MATSKKQRRGQVSLPDVFESMQNRLGNIAPAVVSNAAVTVSGDQCAQGCNDWVTQQIADMVGEGEGLSAQDVEMIASHLSAKSLEVIAGHPSPAYADAAFRDRILEIIVWVVITQTVPGFGERRFWQGATSTFVGIACRKMHSLSKQARYRLHELTYEDLEQEMRLYALKVVQIWFGAIADPIKLKPQHLAHNWDPYGKVSLRDYFLAAVFGTGTKTGGRIKTKALSSGILGMIENGRFKSRRLALLCCPSCAKQLWQPGPCECGAQVTEHGPYVVVDWFVMPLLSERLFDTIDLRLCTECRRYFPEEAFNSRASHKCPLLKCAWSQRVTKAVAVLKLIRETELSETTEIVEDMDDHDVDMDDSFHIP